MGCNFQSAIFTNLTRDHLDYHGSMEEYGKTKERLFTELPFTDKKVVINIDDPFGRKLAKKPQNIITYVIKEGDIFPEKICQTENGLSVKISSPSGVISINSSLVGEYNLYNIMAAIGGAISIGINAEAIEKGINELNNVPAASKEYQLKKNLKGVEFSLIMPTRPMHLKELLPRYDQQQRDDSSPSSGVAEIETKKNGLSWEKWLLKVAIFVLSLQTILERKNHL